MYSPLTHAILNKSAATKCDGDALLRIPVCVREVIESVDQSRKFYFQSTFPEVEETLVCKHVSTHNFYPKIKTKKVYINRIQQE